MDFLLPAVLGQLSDISLQPLKIKIIFMAHQLRVVVDSTSTSKNIACQLFHTTNANLAYFSKYSAKQNELPTFTHPHPIS